MPTRRWGHEPGSIEKAVATRYGGAVRRADDQGISMDAPYGHGRCVWAAGGSRSGTGCVRLCTDRLCDVLYSPKPDGYVLALISGRLHDSETVYCGHGHRFDDPGV